MAQGRITAEAVNALQPEARDHFLWDDKLPGFGVKVTPAGAKIYILQYRIGGRSGKTKRYTLGPDGALRAASARKLAETMYGKVKQGEDIATEKRKKAEVERAKTELAFSPFLEEFAKSTLKAKWPKSWKLAHARLKNHAAVHLGNKPLPDITANDIRQLLRKLDHQPATRRNLFAGLSFLFNQCKRDGLISMSPIEAVEPPPPVAERDRVLNDDELRWLWVAIAEQPSPYREIVEDLIWLGQRRGEVAGMQWAELNRDRREWHLPAARAKNGCANVVPLTARATAKLDKLAGIGADSQSKRWPRSGLVYPSRAGTVPSGWSKLQARLCARVVEQAKEAGAEVERWIIHDLRRTLATRMQRLGIAHEVVEHLLNHREKSRTGIAKVYQTYGYEAEKRAALERWEAELDRILAGGGEAVVVPFRAKETA